MLISEKLQKKLKLLESKGIFVDWNALDQKFNFIFFPICTHEVNIRFVMPLVQSINENLQFLKFNCELDSITVSPIIVDPNISKQTGFMQHRKNENAYHVGIAIDHALWLSSNKKKRIELIENNFIRSVSVIPEKYLSLESKNLILNIIQLNALQF